MASRNTASADEPLGRFALLAPDIVPSGHARTAAARGETATCPQGRGSGTGHAWLDWLDTVMARLREREELRALTPRERRDAGLSDYDVEMLARKPLRRA